MRTEVDFAPMWAVPPGRTISDLMHKKGITPSRLAELVDVSEQQLVGLLAGKSALTESVAARLQGALEIPAAFWLSREKQYRMQLSELNAGVDADKEEYKLWLKSLPLKEMYSLGWINAVKDKQEKLRNCLDFFGVPNIEAWYRTYVDLKSAAAFRTTDAYLEHAPTTAAWLRQGELQAENIECKEWNPQRFAAQLVKIRALTGIAEPSKFLPNLRAICAEAGVAVVIVKAPKGCRASGATFFANPNKAVLLLSFRYLTDDQFWFSFFHEAGHLVLHWNEDLLILETSDGPKSAREEEANQFAMDILVPRELQKNLPAASKTLIGIMRLARTAGVSYGIILGQMQFRGLVRPDRFNRLKIRYKWEQLTAEE
jgi:HTH-type transcriptional regulator/antitoxin HigA